MKLLSILLTLAFFSNTTVALARPRVNRCYQIQEESLSKETVIKSFPEFNIQMRVAKNTNAVKLKDGSILIVDRGTYKYLQCLQNNPNGLGKGIFGVLISRGARQYDDYHELPNRPLVFLAAPKGLQEIVLRFIFYNNQMTDVSLYGGGPLTSRQERQEHMRLLMELQKDVTVISNPIP